MIIRSAFLISILLLSGCATSVDRASRFCESSLFLVDAQFEGGNFARCSFESSDTVIVTVQPEDRPPINQSPWYAFRVSARTAHEISIKLNFEDGYARYWPKVSTDGRHWKPVDSDAVQIADNGSSLDVRLSIGNTALWVSGQELVTTSYYDDWFRELAMHDEVNTALLGRSVQGRPIYVASTGDRPEVVLLIGRQHPPEISGAVAMRRFVDTVLAASELANRFRERYALVIIPLLNPDGVALGYWRHNVNGVDLNRDWGPFTQPETQSVAKLLAGMNQLGMQPRLMLDFHSTKSNLFYTQLAEDNTNPRLFATNWLGRSRERLPDFEFVHAARKTSDQANTKNYFFKRYGIPAITYELADETDRDLIAAATSVFAEEMMRTLLESD